MNVNVKLSISDEDRNLMSRRLTGKDSKKMVSRAEVNVWVKEQLEKFLRLGSPTTEQVDDLVDDSPDEPFFDDPDYASDLSERDIEDVMKRNELLQHRVNVLQHRLDTTR
jgi:hypothetical protein